jgi:flavorubredoxin
MFQTDLYNAAEHRNVFIDESEDGGAIQANNHVIIHRGDVMLLDPGGHKVYKKLMGDVSAMARISNIKTIFLSHQDPDIVASINGWLMTTDAVAYASRLWKRFIPHFGMDHLVADRLLEIPDGGGFLTLGDAEFMMVPAHFLHSAGNFHLYDPISKILYSGDLGSSIGAPAPDVTDFAAHIPYIRGFHQRYMASNKALRLWADMVQGLDIEIIAPQHGAMYRGKALCAELVAYLRELPVGIDLIDDAFQLPKR